MKMKRGRKSESTLFKMEILRVLSKTKYPMLISQIRKIVSASLEREVGWYTIKKYVSQLVKKNRIKEMKTAHTKDPKRPGLTFYSKL